MPVARWSPGTFRDQWQAPEMLDALGQHSNRLRRRPSQSEDGQRCLRLERDGFHVSVSVPLSYPSHCAGGRGPRRAQQHNLPSKVAGTAARADFALRLGASEQTDCNTSLRSHGAGAHPAVKKQAEAGRQFRSETDDDLHREPCAACSAGKAR